MLWGRNVADRLRLESHTQQCYGEGTIYDTQRLLLMKYGSESHQQQCWRKDCCWQVQIRIASANMLKRGKECCRQAQITDTSAAVLCGRRFCWQAQSSHTNSNVKMGTECCWEAQIRNTPAAMLWGRRNADRFIISESRTQQC